MAAPPFPFPLPPAFYQAHSYLHQAEVWWQQYQRTVMIAGGLSFAALLAAKIAWNRHRVANQRDTWGSARWATRREIEAEGLFHDGPGIILGRYGPWWHRQVLCSASDVHAVVFGPTRSLKTWSMIIPSILNWAGSILVLDIKGELYKFTSGYRATLGPVYRFNPLVKETHALDPMAFVRNDWEIADAQRLAEQVTADPDARPDQRAEFWRDQVADWFVTLLLYIRRQTAYANNFAGILGLLRSSTNRKATLHTMAQCPEGEVQAGARRLLGMTTPGRVDEIWDGAIRVLSLWRDPGVAHATRMMDIPLRGFQQGPYPMSLYLQVTAEDLAGRLRHLFRIVLDQLVARLIDRDTELYEQPLLIVLDEVASLGYMNVVEDVCSLAAGYGIRVILAFQSLNQLWRRYGRDTGILDNCPIRVVYEPNNPDTAASLQQLLGEATVSEVTHRRSGSRFGVIYDDAGMQTITHRRDLRTKAELMELGKYTEVIRVSGTEFGLKPILAYKLRYRDREFRHKLLPAV